MGMQRYFEVAHLKATLSHLIGGCPDAHASAFATGGIPQLPRVPNHVAALFAPSSITTIGACFKWIQSAGDNMHAPRLDPTIAYLC